MPRNPFLDQVPVQEFPLVSYYLQDKLDTGGGGSSTSASYADTASYTPNAVITASAIRGGDIINFVKGDGSTFEVAVTASNAVITASAVNTTITFTKGDGSTFDVTVSQSGSVATASYALYAVSASQASTASYYGGSVISASYASSSTSASYALTASYAMNGGSGNTFPYTGSALITGSLGITGSLNVYQSLDTNLRYLYDVLGNKTADWDALFLVDNAAVNSVWWGGRQLYDATGITTVDWNNTTLNDSAGTASLTWGERTLYDATAVSSLNWIDRQLFDASGIKSIDWSSTTEVNVSKRLNVSQSIIANQGIQVNTGNITVLNGFVSASQGFTGSLFGTASWASRAITASNANTASFVQTAQTASYVLQAVSASFASTASYVNTLNQNVLITGSLTVTGSLSMLRSAVNTGENVFYISSSMSTASSGTRTMIQFDLGTTGSNTGNIFGFNANLLAGYTGSSATQAGRFINSAAGTGTNIYSGVVNAAAAATANGVTNGTNFGLGGTATNGLVNIGNRSIGTGGSTAASTNIGMCGFGNTGSSTGTCFQIGGFFGLHSATPTFSASAALMCDNDTQAADIFVARDNGTAIFKIFDGGNTFVGSSPTNAGYKLDINGSIRSQDDFTLADAKNIILGSTTGTKIGTLSSQKIGFWNAAPIIQPTSSVATASFVANAGTAINNLSTFDGYTIGQVVKALRSIGLLA